MKNLIGIFLCSHAIASLAVGETGLRELLDKMDGPTDGEVDFRGRMVQAWQGLDDAAALDELLGVSLSAESSSDDRFNAYLILKAMRIPESQIVDRILELSEGMDSYETGINQVFSLLKDFDGDPRVLPYFAGYIDDKRPAEKRVRIEGEEHFGIPSRICDTAAYLIREALNKRGVMKPGDPGWGQDGGEFSYAEADRKIELLKQVLRQNGLLDAGRIPSRLERRGSDEQDVNSNDIVKLAPCGDDSGNKQKDFYGLITAILLVIVVLSAVAIGFCVKRKSALTKAN